MSVSIREFTQAAPKTGSPVSAGVTDTADRHARSSPSTLSSWGW
jgi:hypothetical protein